MDQVAIGLVLSISTNCLIVLTGTSGRAGLTIHELTTQEKGARCCCAKFSHSPKTTKFYQLAYCSLNGNLSLALDAEMLKEAEDISTLLFSRPDSRRAARALEAWLKEKSGRCTRSEMSGFSRKLESGELGFKFTRTNFYRGICTDTSPLG